MTLIDRLNGITDGVAVKAPCRACATAPITLSGLQTVDGIALSDGDRVLVIGQDDATQNGIWNASTGNWTRALDFDGSRDVVDGTRVLVRSGNENARVEFATVAGGTIVLGATALSFERVSAAAAPEQVTIASVAQLQVTNMPAAIQGVATLGLASANETDAVAPYRRVASEPSHLGKARSQDRFLPDGTVDAANGGWWEISATELHVAMLGGLPSASAAVNTAALAAVLAVAHAQGGKVINLSAGTYLLDPPLDGSFYSILIQDQDNITLRGAGRDVTILKVADPDSSGPISLVRASNIRIEDLSLDGSAGGTYLGFHGIRLQDVQNVTIQRFAIRHVRSYGIGAEDGYQKQLHILDGIIEDVGRDGFDQKNRAEGNEGLVINNIFIGNFGLGLSTGDSALDIRCPNAHVSNIRIVSAFPSQNLNGVHLRVSSPGDNGTGPERAVVTNVTAEHTGATPLWGNAVSVDNIFCTVSNVTGKNLRSVVALSPNSVSAEVTNVTATACDLAVKYSGTNNKVTNVNADGCNSVALFGGTDEWLDGAIATNGTGTDLALDTPAGVRPRVSNTRASSIQSPDTGGWIYGAGNSGFRSSIARTPHNGAANIRQATILLTVPSGAAADANFLVPVGATIIGVVTRVTTALGTSNGTTGYTVGPSGGDVDQWGVATTVTAGTRTGMVGAGPPTASAIKQVIVAADGNVRITAVGGNFNGTGQIRLEAFYFAMEAPLD